MPRWLPRLLNRIRKLAARGQVRLTLKAQRELAAFGAGLDIQDVCDVLAALVADDFFLRADCLVVSFHEDQGEADEEHP